MIFIRDFLWDRLIFMAPQMLRMSQRDVTRNRDDVNNNNSNNSRYTNTTKSQSMLPKSNHVKRTHKSPVNRPQIFGYNPGIIAWIFTTITTRNPIFRWAMMLCSWCHAVDDDGFFGIWKSFHTQESRNFIRIEEKKTYAIEGNTQFSLNPICNPGGFSLLHIHAHTRQKQCDRTNWKHTQIRNLFSDSKTPTRVVLVAGS